MPLSICALPAHPFPCHIFRCIEYSLADADLASTRADLLKVQEDQSKVREAASKVTEDLERAAAELRGLDQELAVAGARRNELQGRKDEAKVRQGCGWWVK